MVDDIDDALEQLAERESRFTENQAQFLTITSHELRTPLTSIAAFTDLFADETTPADQRAQAVAAVQRNVRRMLLLIEDMHLLSRLVSGDLAPVPADVDLPPLLRTVVEQLRSQLPAVTFTVASVESLSTLGDESLLHDLLYTVVGVLGVQTADGEVSVSLSSDDVTWTVSATTSTGEPVSEDHLLTSELPTLEETSRPRSTALWILIADAIAHCHGGTFEARIDGSAAHTRATLPL